MGCRVLHLFVVFSLAGASMACAAVPDPTVPPPGSHAYQMGYADGCGSGQAAVRPGAFFFKRSKQTALYESNADYRQGWDKGQAVCYDDTVRHQPMWPY